MALVELSGLLLRGVLEVSRHCCGRVGSHNTRTWRDSLLRLQVFVSFSCKMWLLLTWWSKLLMLSWGHHCWLDHGFLLTNLSLLTGQMRSNHAWHLLVMRVVLLILVLIIVSQNEVIPTVLSMYLSDAWMLSLFGLNLDLPFWQITLSHCTLLW